MNNKKLYVGSLAYASTDDSLRAFFEQVGEVTSASVVMDKMTGRSRGFGFVEMATDEAAQAAVAQLDGKELDGRAIRVSISRPREDNGGGSRAGGSFQRRPMGGGYR